MANKSDELRAFAERLNRVLDRAGIVPKGQGRQVQVAADLKVSQKGARKWLEGETYPNLAKLAQIARRYGTSMEYLVGAAESPSGKPRHIPVLAWSAVGEWLATGTVDESAIESWVSNDEVVGPRGYGLRLQDDTMAPQFLEGSLLYIDPNIIAGNGSYVIACPESPAHPTFKRLIRDGSRVFLKPINPTYPMTTIGPETPFYGVMIRSLFVRDFPEKS